MDQLQADIFFQLICTRYEAGRSLIITTNRPFILTGESRRLHEHQTN